MNYSDFLEIQQVELAHARFVLGIKDDIIIINDPEKWVEITEDNLDDVLNCYGVADREERLIFINLEEVSTFRRLKENIWHECLHFAFPNKTEHVIRIETKKTIGYNTYGAYGDYWHKNNGMSKREFKQQQRKKKDGKSTSTV